MNTIPKDPYADTLLLNVKISIPGAIIKRDTYADGLLNYVHDKVGTTVFPVDAEATEAVAPKDLGKQQ